MPCLNEAETLEACIRAAQSFLERSGVQGEVLIGDNDSTDDSREVARRCGARVVEISERGYGAALRGASLAANGKYIIAGDSDGSYDFSALLPMLEELRAGSDLVVGNRFKGGIKSGAMPWKNRYIGNPLLSAFGRLLFGAPVGDFHCGLRGYSSEAFRRMGLQTSGMEFASEMIIRATLLGLRVAEVPVTLSPDGRSHPPHLRPWRDGWRHLSFMLRCSLRQTLRSPGIWLFLCVALLFLAVWKGSGGYHDLVYYMDDAQGLWLRGDMSRPGEFEENLYSKYAPGLAVVSGPFVLAGAALERLSGGAVDARNVAALVIPFFAALSCVLLYSIGRRMGCSSRASLWAAVLLAAGSPLLTFSRLFYAEAAVGMFMLLAVWALLPPPPAPPPQGGKGDRKASVAWAALAGAGLAGAVACHYAAAVFVVALWVGMMIVLWRSQRKNAIALTAIPALTVAAILWLNYSRHGSPFRTGYQADQERLSIEHLWANLHYLFSGVSQGKWKPGWLLRTPWILAAIGFLALGRSSSHVRVPRNSLLAGVALQVIFWLHYSALGYSPLRYFQPATVALALGLPLLGDAIACRWPRWGLLLAGGALIAWNLIYFLFMGDDRNMSFLVVPPDNTLLAYTWYMQPFPPEQSDGYSVGTPMGVIQWAILTLLLAGGVASLIVAFKKVEEQQTSGNGKRARQL